MDTLKQTYFFGSSLLLHFILFLQMPYPTSVITYHEVDHELWMRNIISVRPAIHRAVPKTSSASSTALSLLPSAENKISGSESKLIVRELFPEYPILSRRHGEEGLVEFELTCSNDGSWLSYQSIASSEFERLNESALSYIKNLMTSTSCVQKTDAFHERIRLIYQLK